MCPGIRLSKAFPKPMPSADGDLQNGCVESGRQDMAIHFPYHTSGCCHGHVIVSSIDGKK
jgi:hypothetical protein